jgi:hypothetical protein
MPVKKDNDDLRSVILNEGQEPVSIQVVGETVYIDVYDDEDTAMTGSDGGIGKSVTMSKEDLITALENEGVI